jgi:hypothetical protein
LIAFLTCFLKVLVATGLLALAGGFVTVPFRDRGAFSLMLAPMCGMLILPTVTLVFYALNKVSFAQSGLIAAVLCTCLTCIGFYLRRPSREGLSVALSLWPLVVAIATAMFCAASFNSGSPSILYIDGSDHGGYAQAADWLLSHSIAIQPILAPERPYESWPVLMFSLDYRLGSFAAIALVAALNGTSGLFAYDTACAIAFSAASLSVAAVFGRSRLTVIVLSLCLLTTAWFELGRSGYFGKLLAYPACLFLIGLFLTSRHSLTAAKVAVLVLLTVGAATMHAGMITAFFVVGVGAIAVLTDRILGRANNADELIQEVLILAAIGGVALASSGMFARPIIAPGSPAGFYLSWNALLPHFMEVQNPTRDYIPIWAAWLSIGSILALACHLALLVFALLKRSSIALCLAGGPLLICILFVGMDAAGASSARYGVYQFSSIMGSFGFCALVWLMDEPQVRGKRVLAVGGLVVIGISLMLIRLPRSVVSIATYVTDPPQTQIFQERDFNAMAALVGPAILQIDLRDDLNSVAALDEFGRRGIRMQWTAPAWKMAFGYRQWPVPNYEETPSFVIEEKRSPADPQRVLYETAQYRLSRLP